MNLQPLELADSSYIFIPVNDAEEIFEDSYVQMGMTNDGQGSHWSLLLFDKSKEKFCYYDSMGKYNLTAAEKIVKKIYKYICSEGEPKIEICKTPQQNNCVDCGLYMIMIVELLLAQIVHSKSKNQKVYLPDFSELDIWTKRAQLAMMLYNNKRCYSTLRNLTSQMINSVKKPVSEQKENIGKEGVVKVSISSKPTQFSLTDSTIGHHKNLNDNQWETASAKRSKKANNHLTEKSIILKNAFESLADGTEENHHKEQSTLVSRKLSRDLKSLAPRSRTLTKYTWKNPNLRDEKKKSFLVIGDSIIKHVSIPNGKMHCYRGATATQIDKKIVSMSKGTDKPHTVFIHAGTNDLSNTYCPEDVMGALYNTILTTKKSFPDACLVTNSIIARRDVSPGILHQTNQNIRWLCKELGVIYLNVGNYLDDSCLAKDGIHLNRKGTFILSKVIAKTASLCEKVNLRPTKFLNQIEVNCMDKCTIPYLQKKRKAVDQQSKVPQRTSITLEPSTPSTSYRHSTSHPESHTAPSPPLQPFPNPPVSSGSLQDMNAYPPLPAVSFVSSGDSDGMNVSKSTNFAFQPDFALNWSRAKSPVIT
ncbi:SUMO1 sentrin specific peptidase 8 [Homalodisca vitripennis]|nr:SUMO1 sentrin specific peptidase 8 [Homalodisca vitripennis]